ncbi:MAG TPA: hypothetical protein VGG89_01085 [Candidatus Baltobacteraceae bacterium]|jgi:hypothetical protein
MDAGWVAAIASVASAFVVGIAALAAVLQIRHIRNANEITIYLHLADRLESANAHEAFRSYAEFAELLQRDQALRDRMVQVQPVPEFTQIETLLRFLDSLSMLIVTRSMTERLIVMKYGDEIVRLWDALAEAVYLRRNGVPHFASSWEHLAMRSRANLEAGEIDRFYAALRHDPRMAAKFK